MCIYKNKNKLLANCSRLAGAGRERETSEIYLLALVSHIFFRVHENNRDEIETALDEQKMKNLFREFHSFVPFE